MRRSNLFSFATGGSIGLILGINGIHFDQAGFWWFILPCVVHCIALHFARKEGQP